MSHTHTYLNSKFGIGITIYDVIPRILLLGTPTACPLGHLKCALGSISYIATTQVGTNDTTPADTGSADDDLDHTHSVIVVVCSGSVNGVAFWGAPSPGGCGESGSWWNYSVPFVESVSLVVIQTSTPIIVGASHYHHFTSTEFHWTAGDHSPVVGVCPLGHADCMGTNGTTYSYMRDPSTFIGNTSTVIVPLEPAVTTVPATNITSTSATLNGANYSCDPVYFEYELYNQNNNLISSHTTDDQAGPGGAGDPFSQSVLLGAAWYKCMFRAVGEVGVDTYYGDWLVFYNPAEYPWVETLQATGVTDVVATLNGINHGCDTVAFAVQTYDANDVLLESYSTANQVETAGFSEVITMPATWRKCVFRATGVASGTAVSGASFEFYRYVVETLPATYIQQRSAILNGIFWGVSP